MKTLFHGGFVVCPNKVEPLDILVEEGNITAIASHIPHAQAETIVDASGYIVFPGCIDPHVHFRDPGNPEKEDLRTGSIAALAGGVTAFLDMPNTKPSTTTAEALAAKRASAAEKAACDYGFFIGATPENPASLPTMHNVAGVKVYVGSTTGDLLVALPEQIEAVFKHAEGRVVAVHAEWEPRILQHTRIFRERGEDYPGIHSQIRDPQAAAMAVSLCLRLAKQYKTKLHLCHVSTRQELELIARAKDEGVDVTCEACPHHLLLNTRAYEHLGNFAKINPPLRDEIEQRYLQEALKQGLVDMLATDHAPHLIAEKQRSYWDAPSGAPGIEFFLPLMLELSQTLDISLPMLAQLMSIAPAARYTIHGKGGISVGKSADFGLLQAANWTITADNGFRSKAAWSPYTGLTLTQKVQTMYLRGKLAWSAKTPDLALQKGQELIFS